MPFTISTEKKLDYLLIKVKGKIENFEEHKSLARAQVEKILKNNIKKVITDHSEISYSMSYIGLISTTELVQFYIDSFPNQIKNFKVAAVLKNFFLTEGYFWEIYARNKGFDVRAFHKMEDAIEYIKG